MPIVIPRSERSVLTLFVIIAPKAKNKLSLISFSNKNIEWFGFLVVFNFYNAAENYNNQKENTTVAKRVLKSIENKYKQGVVSSLDLVQANNNYLSAENNYLSAVLTLLQAQTALNKLYNKL